MIITWCVVHTKFRQGALADRQLAQQGFRTYLPKYIASKPRRGITVATTELLFPRHVLIEVDLERQDVAPIRSTRGAIGLVRLDADLAGLPAAFIATLQDQEQQTLNPDAPLGTFSASLAMGADTSYLPPVQKILTEPNGDRRVMLLLGLLTKIKR